MCVSVCVETDRDRLTDCVYCIQCKTARVLSVNIVIDIMKKPMPLGQKMDCFRTIRCIISETCVTSLALGKIYY